MATSTLCLNGKKLNDLRLLQGWSREDLAEKAGCSVKTIENAEAGKPVFAANCARIAKSLHVDVKDLLDSAKEQMPSLTDVFRRGVEINAIVKLGNGGPLVSLQIQASLLTRDKHQPDHP